MTGYEITYTPTGKHNSEQKVVIWDTDCAEYGVTETGLVGVLKTFEVIAAKNWKSYETMYAITNISKYYEC